MMERKNISQEKWKGDFYQRKRDSKQLDEVNSLIQNSFCSFGKIQIIPKRQFQLE